MSPTSKLDVTGDFRVTGNLNAVSVSADGSQRLRFTEPGGLNTNSWLGAPTHYDLTNTANNGKRAITMDVRTTSTVPTINTGGIAVNIFTPPDNGGDVSGIWILQTGGGNALSAFNLSKHRPAGYPEYSTGYGIEVAVDRLKHAVVANAFDGNVFLAYMEPGTTTIGYNVVPISDTNLSRRAFRVTNAGNTAEKFFVQLDGTTYIAGQLTVGGCINGGYCSDKRLKKNVRPYEEPVLDKLSRLDAKAYEWKDREGAGVRVGVVAQEVEVLFPEVVTTGPGGEQKGLDCTGLNAITIEAIKELKAKSEEAIKELAARNVALEAKVEALEAKVR